jgi:transcriptional regulator with XRE-family HTH domain
VTSQEGLDNLSRTIRSKGHRALVNALIEARMVRGLSQDALAERLGCHQSLIARIESGQRRIDVVELVVFCRALGASPVELLEVTEAATDAQHQIV